MRTIQEQFTFQSLADHFEKDTHIDVQALEIENIHVLYGETPIEDILVVLYKASPNLSFYNAQGQLIDIDHYLPNNYTKQDEIGSETLLANLRQVDLKKAEHPDFYQSLLEDTFAAGQGNFIEGLKAKHGLAVDDKSIKQYFHKIGISNDRLKTETLLESRFETYSELLKAIIVNQQKSDNGYVHITPNDNIIITPLNKRSGVAVIIETQSVDGLLLPPNKWMITRTQDITKFEQALVFRTEDVKAFFDADAYEEYFETTRYKLYHSPSKLTIDSLIDNTDNTLELELINNCYQVLASDINIIIALTSTQEVTIINTHRSIVPHKWPKKIVLPEYADWIRADENLTVLFMRNREGEIIALDITNDHPQEIAKLGKYARHFEIDQEGSLIVKKQKSNQLIKIKTNVNELELEEDQKHFGSVIKSLSYLFKGERLFTKTQFAKVVTEEKPQPKKKLPSAIEVARYDFETNIEHMLANAENSYEKLLKIQNKIAIARQNIAEELSTYAEKEGIFLVGQRLQSTINSIIRPIEKHVKNLVELKRAEDILQTTKSYRDEIDQLKDPDAYRDILNSIRKYEEELRVIMPENKAGVIS